MISFYMRTFLNMKTSTVLLEYLSRHEVAILRETISNCNKASYSLTHRCIMILNCYKRPIYIEFYSMTPPRTFTFNKPPIFAITSVSYLFIFLVLK